MELPELNTLKHRDIFVFQTNENGFHGGGSASWAFNGKATSWQRNRQFQAQWNSGERVRGLFAILRQPAGLMAGTDGIGYGIVTCVTAAQPKSVPISDIEAQLKELRSYTIRKPFLNFILASIGTGHAGYTQKEMWEVYTSVTEGRMPNNWFIIKNKQRVSFKYIFDSELKGKFVCLR
jgi:hypothetical protein